MIYVLLLTFSSIAWQGGLIYYSTRRLNAADRRPDNAVKPHPDKIIQPGIAPIVA